MGLYVLYLISGCYELHISINLSGYMFLHFLYVIYQCISIFGLLFQMELMFSFIYCLILWNNIFKVIYTDAYSEESNSKTFFNTGFNMDFTFY